jgi:hypothetical protein
MKSGSSYRRYVESGRFDGACEQASMEFSPQQWQGNCGQVRDRHDMKEADHRARILPVVGTYGRDGAI